MTSLMKFQWTACQSTPSLVRQLLLGGEMEKAARFLGHPHCLGGQVITGKRLGRTIGIPTANIPVPRDVLTLPFGVYATKVAFEGEEHLAVTNVGDCPPSRRARR